ncbi:MAG: DnaJ domain-containing protein [Candidatus Dadabacteria bacterium]|nr:DnaJ domain-containing protein [Candidatus Dadabacteria bacterium]
MNSKKNPYSVLGISRDATQDQIKKAYRDLARKHHPDMNQGDKTSEEKFKEIQHAYEILSDSEKRKNYDMFGGESFSDRGQGTYGQYSRGFPGIDEIFKDMFSQRGVQYRADGSFGDLFDFPGARRERPKNIEYSVTLDFETAVKGGEKELLIKSSEEDTRKITVNIPAGVNTGSRVRLPRKDNQRSSAADIVLVIKKVFPHPLFIRENDDIYIDLPLTIYEAALGTSIDVPTVYGPVKLTIPPGVRNGTKMKLKEKGVRNPKTSERGSQFVVIQIVMPEQTEKGLEEIIREMKERYPYNPRKKLSRYL